MHNAELFVVFQFWRDEIVVPCFLAIALISLGRPCLGSKELMQHADKLAILFIYVAHSTPRIIERVENSNNVASPLNQLQTGSVVVECYVSPVDAFKARE